MPFKLVIRHSIGDAHDEFAGADVRHFDETDVSVGSSSDCDCRIDDPRELKPRHFYIRFDEGGGYLLVPEEGASVFHNGSSVQAPLSLISGDEIRAGHIVFRFQKEYQAVRPARRTNFLEILAKAIIAFVLILEVFFVYWLPRRIQSESLLATDIMHQQTVLLLDRTRLQARRPGGEMSAFQSKANELILEELDRMAQFIRENEKGLSDTQWRWFFNATRNMNELLQGVKSGAIEPPLPEPALRETVKKMLHKKTI
ncbi:MAG: FHA domain-containing protein [Lentisphaeria bacterium]